MPEQRRWVRVCKVWDRWPARMANRLVYEVVGMDGHAHWLRLVSVPKAERVTAACFVHTRGRWKGLVARWVKEGRLTPSEAASRRNCRFDGVSTYTRRPLPFSCHDPICPFDFWRRLARILGKCDWGSRRVLELVVWQLPVPKEALLDAEQRLKLKTDCDAARRALFRALDPRASGLCVGRLWSDGDNFVHSMIIVGHSLVLTGSSRVLATRGRLRIVGAVSVDEALHPLRYCQRWLTLSWRLSRAVGQWDRMFRWKTF